MIFNINKLFYYIKMALAMLNNISNIILLYDILNKILAYWINFIVFLLLNFYQYNKSFNILSLFIINSSS